jgi:tRNA(fMet)-specific endonuclease VapC
VPRDELGILDTSVIVSLETLDPVDLPRTPLITAVTLAELAVGPLVTDDEAERLRRQTRLLQAEADFDPVPFDDNAARVFGTVAANLRGAGRKPAARSYDAMIAAIAVSRNLPLYTGNPRDFRFIDALRVVSVPRRD